LEDTALITASPSSPLIQMLRMPALPSCAIA